MGFLLKKNEIEYHVNLWPETVRNKLSTSIVRGDSFFAFPFRLYWDVGDSATICGVVGDSEFRIWNKYPPWFANPVYFHGYIEPESGRTRVYGRFKWHPLIKFGLGFAFTASFIILLGIFLSTSKESRTGSIIGFTLGLGYPILAYGLSNITYEVRKKRIKDLLSSLFG